MSDLTDDDRSHVTIGMLRHTVDQDRIVTHSPGCWAWHRDCALLMACDLAETAEAKLAAVADAVDGDLVGFLAWSDAVLAVRRILDGGADD